MKIEQVLFDLVVAAPLVCQFFARSTVSRTILSATVSVVLMTLCIVIGEARDALPDYDIVFGVSLIGWDVLAFIYAVVVSLALKAIASLAMGLRNPKGTLKHEE